MVTTTLLVYLHGFKGGDHTFGDFPMRISTVLSETYSRSHAFRTIIYPAYQTKGHLAEAVDSFAAWLIETYLTATHESNGNPLTATHEAEGNPVDIILLAHSMGGLVIADTLLSLRSSASPNWPPIRGLLAFDTPYLGLNPAVFKNTAEKYIGMASQGQAALSALGVGWGVLSSFSGTKSAASAPPTASSSTSKESTKSKSTPSTSTAVLPSTSTNSTTASGSSWLLPSLGALTVAGVAAAGMYYKKDLTNHVTSHVTWTQDHLSFLVELWHTEAMDKRMLGLERAKNDGIGFACLYTLLPPLPGASNSTPPRTFIILPSTSTSKSSFSPNTNTRAADEIQAHVDMFEDKNDGVYALGRESVLLIGKWLVFDAKPVEKGAAKEEEKLI